MTATKPIDLVIFDCDGVLVDSERLINRIEAQLVSEVGLDFLPDQARATFKGHTVGEIVAIIEARTGARVSAEWLYDWGMRIALGFVKELRSVAGLGAVLDELRNCGVPSCVASQSPRARVDLALTVTDLARYFDGRVFTASMVPRSKPHPDVFLYAAARMGSEPTRCAVIEDSPTGVRAAVAAGMRVFGYAADEDAGALERAGAERTFHAMGELPALLECSRRQDSGDPRQTPVAPSAAAGVHVAYEAFGSGDGQPLAELLADEVVYHLPGEHLGGGTLRGRADVFRRIADAASVLDAPPTISLQNVVGFGEWALSIERFTARRGGHVLDQEVCVVWRIVDARCVEMWARFSDQASCDRFWRTS
jgi:beta-phosphoglucomutase-like phosphatase (HAD superfamily)/ketosteroid isomerase-like protein